MQNALFIQIISLQDHWTFTFPTSVLITTAQNLKLNGWQKGEEEEDCIEEERKEYEEQEIEKEEEGEQFLKLIPRGSDGCDV